MESDEIEIAFQSTKVLLKSSYKFNPKPFLPDVFKEIQSLILYKGKSENEIRQTAKRIKAEQRDLFESLLVWRFNIAKIIDEKPNNVVHSSTLLQISTTANISLDLIQAYLSSNSSTHKSLKGQDKVINNLCHGQSIEELLETECHNCLQKGHGPAWACPFPKNKDNYKLWFNRPENKEYKMKQNLRRKQNWESKRSCE